MRKISLELANPATSSEKAGRDAEVDHGATLLLFAEASEVARNGYYHDAEILVRQALCRPSGVAPALWNLLAKVYAQQGRYIDAESCWREALSLAPGTLEYFEGIRTIALHGQKRPIVRGLKWLFAAFVFAVCGYLGAAAHQYLHGHSRDRATESFHEQAGVGRQAP